MTAILEMHGHLGLDQTGMPGVLDSVGFHDLTISPSASPITGEQSRIIPGSRLVETGSAAIAARLVTEGEFGYGVSPFPWSIFTQDATLLARASATEVSANHYAEKVANQLYYTIAAQSGKFFGYAGLGTNGAPEGNQVQLEWKQFNQALYVVPASQPNVKVWYVKQEALEAGKLKAEETLQPGGESSNLQSFFEAVPMPTGGEVLSGQLWPEGTDRHVQIWRPSTDEYWEMWRLGKFSAGERNGEWKFAYGAYIPGVSKKQNGVIMPQSGLATPHEGWGARASGLAAVGGDIMIADVVRVLRGGKIGHAIGFALCVTKGPAGSSHLAPAVRNDTKNNTSGTAESNPAFGAVDAVPEGAWFAFPPASRASEFVNTGTEPLAAAIYEAIREHGMFINDSGGNSTVFMQDPRVLGSPYIASQANPFAGWTGTAPSAAEVSAYVKGGVTDATLPAIKENFRGTSSVFSKMPWRTLEQLAPRTS